MSDQEEKYIDMVFKYSEDLKIVTITLSSDKVLDDSDVYVALKYCVENYAPETEDEEPKETYH